MLGDSLKRRHEGRLKLAAAAGGAGWVAFGILLVLFFGLQARHQQLVHGVAQYRAEMETTLATATTYAYQMESALRQCEEGGSGDLAEGLLKLGLPVLLQGIGLPPVVTRILSEELGG